MNSRWHRRRGLAAFVLVGTLLVGCSGKPSGNVAAPRPAPVDPWVLTCNDPRQTEPALLWNGKIGLRIGRDGTGHGLPSFDIDEYDTQGEEKLRTLVSPLEEELQLDGAPVQIDPSAPYAQTLDMRDGALTTSYRSMSGLQVSCQTYLHPHERIVGQHWSITSDHAGMLGLVEIDPKSGRHQGSLKHVEPNEAVTIDRVLALPQPENWLAIQRARGREVRVTENWNAAPPTRTFESLKAETAKIWQARWNTDIVVDGPVEDQQAIRSFMFYLRSAIVPDAAMSVSPMALSSSQYHGHVFWDADLWVAPALAFIEPPSVTSIANYRNEQAQPVANFKAWLRARPTGNRPLGPSSTPDFGMKYAWESSVTGKETTPGPSKFEDHITGTVAFSQAFLSHLGLADWEGAEDIMAGAKTFYRNRSERGSDGLLHLKGTMSPDENHTGDDDLYTNLLAMWTTSDGKWPSPPTYFLPRDRQTFLTYADDPVKGYKQAAAVLSIYPLQYPPAEKMAKEMMERFAGKVSKNGPAMTDSIHATIWARLGERERAYEAWHASWQPFTQAPLMLFSEKRSSLKTYFTTGAAGSLNAVLYGFLGFRLDSEQEKGAAWSKKLNGENWLSIKPNLPPTWKSVTFKRFHLLGKSYTLTATSESTQVVQGD